MNSKVLLVTALSIFGASTNLAAAPLNLNFSDIYINNKTGKDLTVSEQRYEKVGFADAKNQTKTKPGFVVKPGKKVKVASIDRDQSSYPDDAQKYLEKYATVSFSVNGTSYTFTSDWEVSGKTKAYTAKTLNAPKRSVNLLPLSSTLTVNDGNYLPYSKGGAYIYSYYVFLKLYHDVEMLFK